MISFLIKKITYASWQIEKKLSAKKNLQILARLQTLHTGQDAIIQTYHSHELFRIRVYVSCAFLIMVSFVFNPYEKIIAQQAYKITLTRQAELTTHAHNMYRQNVVLTLQTNDTIEHYFVHYQKDNQEEIIAFHPHPDFPYQGVIRRSKNNIIQFDDSAISSGLNKKNINPEALFVLFNQNKQAAVMEIPSDLKFSHHEGNWFVFHEKPNKKSVKWFLNPSGKVAKKRITTTDGFIESFIMSQVAE